MYLTLKCGLNSLVPPKEWLSDLYCNFNNIETILYQHSSIRYTVNLTFVAYYNSSIKDLLFIYSIYQYLSVLLSNVF